MYCLDPENIENFDKAKADNFVGWEVHHRLETHTSDGERRLVDISKAELKALDMYYNVPAEQLIYLTKSEHTSLHHKGNKHHLGMRLSDETKKKLSEVMKGENNPFYGKHHSEEVRKKLSEAQKGEKNHNYGKQFSEETKKKIGETKKGNTYVRGSHWYNNGEICVRAKECPAGFIPGRLTNK